MSIKGIELAVGKNIHGIQYVGVVITVVQLEFAAFEYLILHLLKQRQHLLFDFLISYRRFYRSVKVAFF
jgi:hypothetical protein